MNDQSDPSQAQLDDLDGLDDSFGGGGLDSGDGSTADGFGPFGDTGNGAALQEDSLPGVGDGDSDSVNLGDVKDATSTGTPLANDDTTQTDSSTPGFDDSGNNAAAVDDASSDATNLDSQDGCSGSPCGGSDGPSIDGSPTIRVDAAQAPDAGSGSGDDSGLAGTGDSTASGVGTDDASGADGSGGPLTEASDAGVIGNAAFGDFLGDDSSHQAGADAATDGLTGSRTGTDDDGSFSDASSPALGESPPAVDASLPALASSSPTGVSSVSSDPFSVGNNDTNAQLTDASQDASSSASGGSSSVAGGAPPPGTSTAIAH